MCAGDERSGQLGGHTEVTIRETSLLKLDHCRKSQHQKTEPTFHRGVVSTLMPFKQNQRSEASEGFHANYVRWVLKLNVKMSNTELRKPFPDVHKQPQRKHLHRQKNHNILTKYLL